MICFHCGKDPGTKDTGVWKGFLDKDTDQHVCWKCQAHHYRKKFKDFAINGLYSEFPVMILPAQLQIRFPNKLTLHNHGTSDNDKDRM